MNDCSITYIEKDLFNCVDNEKIMQSFKVWRLIEEG